MTKASHCQKGMTRSYNEALELGAIDKRIRKLVDAFNVPGIVSTHASCEGHRWRLMRVPQFAFVMFQTRTDLAFQLAKRIRADRLIGPRHLNYHWSIEATFDDDSDSEKLLFTLRCHADRFRRARLDEDFVTLAGWAGEIFAQAKIHLIPIVCEPNWGNIEESFLEGHLSLHSPPQFRIAYPPRDMKLGDNATKHVEQSDPIVRAAEIALTRRLARLDWPARDYADQPAWRFTVTGLAVDLRLIPDRPVQACLQVSRVDLPVVLEAIARAGLACSAHWIDAPETFRRLRLRGVSHEEISRKLGPRYSIYCRQQRLIAPRQAYVQATHRPEDTTKATESLLTEPQPRTDSPGAQTHQAPASDVAIERAHPPMPQS